ncbi:hypothetical protein ACSVDA_14250 [Cytobacillus sp. Hm23]
MKKTTKYIVLSGIMMALPFTQEAQAETNINTTLQQQIVQAEKVGLNIEATSIDSMTPQSYEVTFNSDDYSEVTIFVESFYDSIDIYDIDTDDLVKSFNLEVLTALSDNVQVDGEVYVFTAFKEGQGFKVLINRYETNNEGTEAEDSVTSPEETPVEVVNQPVVSDDLQNKIDELEEAVAKDLTILENLEEAENLLNEVHNESDASELNTEIQQKLIAAETTIKEAIAQVEINRLQKATIDLRDGYNVAYTPDGALYTEGSVYKRLLNERLAATKTAKDALTAYYATTSVEENIELQNNLTKIVAVAEGYSKLRELEIATIFQQTAVTVQYTEAVKTTLDEAILAQENLEAVFQGNDIKPGTQILLDNLTNAISVAQQLLGNGSEPDPGTEPDETNPTEPNQPDPGTEPDETNPTEPNQPDPGTEPGETNPTEPNQPDSGTEPDETDPTGSNQPDPGTEPDETDPTGSNQPDPGTEPIETDPTENDNIPTDQTPETTIGDFNFKASQFYKALRANLFTYYNTSEGRVAPNLVTAEEALLELTNATFYLSEQNKLNFAEAILDIESKEKYLKGVRASFEKSALTEALQIHLRDTRVTQVFIGEYQSTSQALLETRLEVAKKAQDSLAEYFTVDNHKTLNDLTKMIAIAEARSASRQLEMVINYNAKSSTYLESLNTTLESATSAKERLEELFEGQIIKSATLEILTNLQDITQEAEDMKERLS